jgi:predicted aspartyl protease
MASVATQLTILNRLDEILFESGRLPGGRVRKIVLSDVVVSPDATTLCLPVSKIEELGLSLLQEASALTADGFKRTRIFQDAKVCLMGRVGTFQCIELAEGESPILGRTPMTALGLEIDHQTQQLKLIPEPYLRI